MQWHSPLDYARALSAEPHLVLLYSGQRNAYSGRRSILAWGLEEEARGESFLPLESRLTRDRTPFDNAWFGYLGYGLKDTLESLPRDQPGRIRTPSLWMGRFRHILFFDHDAQLVTSCGTVPAAVALRPASSQKLPEVLPQTLGSNMTKASYLQKALEVIERIHRGDLYQANLTRKFWGQFAATPDSFTLFERLCTVSPATFSAYLRLPEVTVLSSSPESFLHIEPGGHVSARPIKGSAPRGATPEEDEAILQRLQESHKDQAENLMIVDLLRNDLSRCAATGSVQVSGLFEVATLSTIHHLYSTIEARLAGGCTPLDMVKACFPPGSMTGAPKIAAMRLCSQLEGMERGIYSGALGLFGGDGSVDLSVVIRTLLLQEDGFEFQVGGGIVADSTPEGEWAESLTKARGMAAALGIAPALLENL